MSIKQMLAVIMAIAMLCAISPAVLAVDEQNVSINEMIAINDSGINPLSIVELKSDSGMVRADSPIQFAVTPARGTNLRITIGCSSSMDPAILYCNGKVINIPANDQAVTYTLVTNCSGKSYTIRMEAKGLVSYLSYVVFSSDYTS